MNKSEISKAAQAMGRKGGLATFKKYGKKHYEKMVQIRKKKIIRGRKLK